MLTLIVEGIITFIIVAALFYVAPGVLGSIKTAVPTTTDPSLNAASGQIGTTVSGGLNLATISVIMLGIGLMIGGFMFIRGRKQ